VITIKRYGGYNVEDLEFLGKGTQGKVYRIDPFRCIKIFKSKEVCSSELKTLMMAQKDPHFPRLYGAGERYIVREYIDGIELDKYLKFKSLEIDMSKKIIRVYDAFRSVGFKRLDAALFHILVTKGGHLKVIDTAKAMKKNALHPKLILRALEDLGYRELFLKHVELLRPDLYISWKKIK
jgi:predicted Ser/Thr protein kinase